MYSVIFNHRVAAARSDDCPTSFFWKRIPCDQNPGPIGPIDVSDDAVGMKQPQFRPHSTVGRLQSTQPHMHKWAEHKSKKGGSYSVLTQENLNFLLTLSTLN